MRPFGFCGNKFCPEIINFARFLFCDNSNGMPLFWGAGQEFWVHAGGRGKGGGGKVAKNMYELKEKTVK